jgi:hypothetical protein
LLQLVGWIFEDISEMHDAAATHSTARAALGTDRHRKAISRNLDACGINAMDAREVKLLAVGPLDEAEIGIAESHATLCDCVENRLRICRGAPDDPQDLADRTFTRQSFRQGPLQLCI